MPENLYEIILKHKEYKTLLELKDPKGLVAVARWNWNEDTVNILDCVVRTDYRCSKTIKYLINLGFKANPKANNMTFRRGYKYPDRKPKIYKVRRK